MLDKESAQKIEKRTDKLLSQMTLEQKIAQLQCFMTIGSKKQRHGLSPEQRI